MITEPRQKVIANPQVRCYGPKHNLSRFDVTLTMYDNNSQEVRCKHYSDGKCRRASSGKSKPQGSSDDKCPYSF
jgi:hypothetical protein